MDDEFWSRVDRYGNIIFKDVSFLSLSVLMLAVEAAGGIVWCEQVYEYPGEPRYRLRRRINSRTTKSLGSRIRSLKCSLQFLFP